MINLLSADFARLKKNKVFYACVLFMVMFSAYAVIMRRRNAFNSGVDAVFFFHVVIAVILSAVFCGLFIGTDYADGTIRNKLIVGHNRCTVYLSNLIVCTAASLVMSLSCIATVTVLGIPLLGRVQMPVSSFCLLLLISLTTVIAFVSLYTLMGMLITNKATAAVSILVFMIAILLLGSVVYEKLSEPELITNYVMTDAQGG